VINKIEETKGIEEIKEKSYKLTKNEERVFTGRTWIRKEKNGYKFKN